MLILNDLPVWHWAIGGAVIGLVTLSMLFFTNRRLGVSTGFESVCAIASRLPYFRRPQLTGAGSWRLYFLTGLVAGGALSAVFGGGWSPTWDLGMFDGAISASPWAKVGWMFAGGMFIGFGTRLAGGCTSGHGIFGLSNFEKSGLVATVAYMAAGAVTTNLVYRVLVG
jgi:uncharacterized membrane protein YedE/YeeE